MCRGLRTACAVSSATSSRDSAARSGVSPPHRQTLGSRYILHQVLVTLNKARKGTPFSSANVTRRGGAGVGWRVRRECDGHASLQLQTPNTTRRHRREPSDVARACALRKCFLCLINLDRSTDVEAIARSGRREGVVASPSDHFRLGNSVSLSERGDVNRIVCQCRDNRNKKLAHLLTNRRRRTKQAMRSSDQQGILDPRD